MQQSVRLFIGHGPIPRLHPRNVWCVVGWRNAEHLVVAMLHTLERVGVVCVMYAEGLLSIAQHIGEIFEYHNIQFIISPVAWSHKNEKGQFLFCRRIVF